MKSKVQGIVGAIFIIFCVTFWTVSQAAETRGLRVVAKETSTGQQKEVKLYNKSYAVIIGIDQYQNLSQDRQLVYAVRDAKGVEEVLRKNFKFDKIITLYNREATKDNILKVMMGDLANELTEEDALFVFWAGHGNQEKTRTGDLGYLIPYDGSSKNNELYKNITMSQIRDDISKKIPAKHVFYVMDACYGGLLAQTRAVDKQQTKRDFNYLQEITKEPVRQVLTAGGKDQEVLDGGPRGHSVFTGRLIEELEKAEDFISANELQAVVKEKVFSDARARQHNQTPGYGALYGVGDFVFVPSLDRKVEDTQGKIDGLQADIDKLNKMELDAAKAANEQQLRQIKIDKKQAEAKIAAEKLRQQNFDEQRKKREAEQREDERQQAEAVRQKKDNDVRIAQLAKDVAEKRKSLEGATLSSLSPQKTLDEMQSIQNKIKQVRVQFRNELKNGINQVVSRMNQRYLKLADAKKDEFESEPEFQVRIVKEKAALDNEQATEFTAVQNRLENEYNNQIAPFIEELKKLSGHEFTITAENLTIELGTYDGASNTYPVSIKSKKPLEIIIEEGKKISKQIQVASAVAPAQSAKKGKKQTAQVATAPTYKTIIEQTQPKMKYIMLASNANIPIPRDEAREFKQHFQNNMLRAEITGNFESPETFTVADAKIIDDATVKSYSLFTATFVDLGNGTVYDTTTKLIWSKDGNSKGKIMDWTESRNYISHMNKTAFLGFRDWRLPSRSELNTLRDSAIKSGFGSIARYLNQNNFVSVMDGWYWSSDKGNHSWSPAWSIDMRSGKWNDNANVYESYFLPVRGELAEQQPNIENVTPTAKKLKKKQ